MASGWASDAGWERAPDAEAPDPSQARESMVRERAVRA